MRANEILETCLYVDDLDTAQRFYTTVLGLTPFERHPTRHLFFQCGRRMLLLFNENESELEASNLPPHGARGPGHVAFAVPDEDIPRWREHLQQHRVAIEKTVHWPQGGRSLYFRDPAGNSLEVASPRIWGLDEAVTMGDDRRPCP